MNKIETGGSAFPSEEWLESNDPRCINPVRHSGMTLRDYFAAKAMQAHITAQWAQHYATHTNDDDTYHWDGEDIAMCAYDLADAMLEARK